MSETIVQRTERIRLEDERRQSAARAERQRVAMHAAKNRYVPLARGATACTNATGRVRERHPDVAAGDLRTACTAFAVFIPFAAIFADGVLNGGAFDWLIGHTGGGPVTHPMLLRYLFLAVIVFIETELGLRIQHARDDGQRGAGRATGYTLAGVALILMMAVMTLIITSATTHASHVHGFSVLLPWPATAVTVVVHGLTIFSGLYLRTGASWISYQVQMRVLSVLGVLLSVAAERARQAVGRHFGVYVTLFERYNLEYPDHPLRFGPIDIECEAILRTLFAAEDLDRWLGRRPQNPPPTSNTPMQPPPSSQSGVPPTGSPSSGTTDGGPPTGATGASENTVDTEYSTLVAEEEARHADSEVRP